jgi:type II secretion system protein D
MKSTSPSARAALIRTAFVIAQIGTAACLPALAQNAPPKSPATNAAPAVASTNSLAATAAISTNAPATTDGIQLSFQGANIDMIVQWLSQTTGKSVLKHPQAQCQLTIVGTKKVSPREAISLVYRALSLEGFTAIESGNSILIVPEGKEPKLGPELVDPARSDIPVGHQRLVKIFPLKMAAAADIRDKIKPLLSDKASLEINDRANQLIITDYTDGLNLASDLIKALDTDQPGDRIVRVIPLKHVSAQELVKEIGPLYQKIGGKNAGDSAEVSANERSNSLIVLSSEVNYRAIEKVVRILDTDDAQEKSMRAFPLKNADAEDVAKQIKELLQNKDSSNRYPFYSFSSSESSERGGKKASVVADRRRNTVIVQAPPAELVGLAKMIEALDEPVEGESLAPHIFSLKYISAVDVEDVLNELFLKKQQQQRQYYSFDEPPLEADRNVGRLYGKVRITSEPYSNTMIVTSNSKESLAAVVDVLKRLDVPSQAGESTLRVVLKFAKASTVANSLNVLFAKGGSPPLRPGNTNPQQNPNQQNQQQNQGGPSSDNSFQLEQENEDEGYFPWLGGQPENTRGADGRASARQVSDLVGRVRAVPDLRSNSLLLSANVHLLPQLIKLIDDLDAPTPQVLIEARIVEVSSDFLDKLGVRWSPDGKKVFTADDYDNSLVAGTTTKYAKGFGGPTAINSGGGASIAAAITSLRSGVIDSSVSIDFLIQFLRKNVNATVLAEPQINVRDNETAKLFVGSQVPFLKDSQSTPTGSLNQSFSYKDVGVILEVVPHVNKDGDVSLKIRTESSTVAPTQSIAGGVTLDTRNFKTFVTARSGETLVIGGIIQKQMSDTVRKVPVLGSIPGLGWAFKKKDKSIQEVELLVFLKTTVVTNTKEARAMTDEVDRRMPLIQKMNEDEARKTGTNSGKKTIPPAKTKP